MNDISPVNKDVLKFGLWTFEAKKGDVYEYHRGFLCRDASEITGDKNAYKKLESMRDAAWRASALGQVALVQKREGVCDYRYLAQRL